MDAVIYIDADTLVLADLNKLWAQFKQFDSMQAIGVANEAEDPNVSYYKQTLPYPYFGATGINTGVCLFNLTRMRECGFERRVLEIFDNYRHMSLKYGDQCLMNIFLWEYPGNEDTLIVSHHFLMQTLCLKLIFLSRKSLFIELCMELSNRTVSIRCQVSYRWGENLAWQPKNIH